jgi:hypothetical protein
VKPVPHSTDIRETLLTRGQQDRIAKPESSAGLEQRFEFCGGPEGNADVIEVCAKALS